jgi:FdhD protein
VLTNSKIPSDRLRGFSRVHRYIGTECSAPEILTALRTAGDVPRISRAFTIGISKLYEIRNLLKASQEGHKRTGAFHAALLHHLINEDHVLAEDLGRHNALDKAIGLAVTRGLDLTECLLFSTGRLTADVVSKCAWTSIPLLVSSSVATDAGVTFATKANVTLIGAFKGRTMRLYHEGATRIAVLR